MHGDYTQILKITAFLFLPQELNGFDLKIAFISLMNSLFLKYFLDFPIQ